MQVQIKFIRHGGSPMTGEFSPGDTLRCDAVLAHHLVDQVKCARYVEQKKSTKSPKKASKQ